MLDSDPRLLLHWLRSRTDFDCITSCATGLAALPAARRKKARRKNTGLDTDYKACIFAWLIDMLALQMLLYKLRTSTASHHAPRGWQPCPLQSKNRQGWKNTGLNTDFKACIFAWLIDGSCWTLDCSCIGYGLQLFHIMRHGAGRLVCCKAKKGKEKKTKALARTSRRASSPG